MRRSSRKATNATGIRTGTLTLLLLVVAIVLAVVAVLAMQTARSNDARANAFTYNVEQFYKNDAAAQKMLAELDAAIASGDASSAIPGEFTVEGNRFSGGYMDGAACSPSDINTTTDTYVGGMAADGLSKEDANSTPALLIEVSYDDNGYTVHAWNHVRAY